ncbi:hypothetical protein PQC53_31880 (plasmid) [Pseudomonas aeruginosa]|nr:hypothetical protein PQC53_31880 [Pseudomonas aeruginosa]
MSKRVLAVLLLTGLAAGCSTTPPPALVTSQAPSYGYKPLGGTLDAERPQGQTIRLVYGGKRYQVTPDDEESLKQGLATAAADARFARSVELLEEGRDGPGMWDDVKLRWNYAAAVSSGMQVMRAIEGQPVPMVAVSDDPAKPCTIELPPPRNSGDADFFRALGEATFACMKGEWR